MLVQGVLCQWLPFPQERKGEASLNCEQLENLASSAEDGTSSSWDIKDVTAIRQQWSWFCSSAVSKNDYMKMCKLIFICKDMHAVHLGLLNKLKKTFCKPFATRVINTEWWLHGRECVNSSRNTWGRFCRQLYLTTQRWWLPWQTEAMISFLWLTLVMILLMDKLWPRFVSHWERSGKSSW